MVGTLIKSLGKHGIKFGLEDFQNFFYSVCLDQMLVCRSNQIDNGSNWACCNYATVSIFGKLKDRCTWD